MYKDKQREANRLSAKRYRDKRKGMTQRCADTVIPTKCDVIPERHTLEPVVEQQSYNPMMVGYVSPTGGKP